MTKFKDLTIGETFDWIDDDSPYNSFFKRCQKTSARMYRDSDGWHHQVGSINAKVFHLGQDTPGILREVIDHLTEARKKMQSIKNDDWYFTRQGYTAFTSEQLQLTGLIDELQARWENIQE